MRWACLKTLQAFGGRDCAPSFDHSGISAVDCCLDVMSGFLNNSINNLAPSQDVNCHCITCGCQLIGLIGIIFYILSQLFPWAGSCVPQVSITRAVSVSAIQLKMQKIIFPCEFRCFYWFHGFCSNLAQMFSRVGSCASQVSITRAVSVSGMQHEM